MASAKTKKVVGVVAGSLLVAVIITAILLRHPIEHGLTLAGGKRAIANHAAAPLDLATSYQTPASYFAKITSFPAWGTVPIGFQVFDDVPLQINGMMCLWGELNTKYKIIFPEQILGIKLNQKFETLYVYHTAFFESPDHMPVCEVVFRYTDGSSLTNELRYGDDTLDWEAGAKKPVPGPKGPNSKLAWVGGSTKPTKKNSPLRFFLTAINNPMSSVEVESIDLYSSKNKSAACILAMTAGKAGLMK